jgi:hypothetical protein
LSYALHRPENTKEKKTLIIFFFMVLVKKELIEKVKVHGPLNKK